MKAAIRQRVLALGFDDCRFTTAALPQSAPHLQQWLADGRHGEMNWLDRNALKRVNPQLVLPGAHSAICHAKSYSTTTDQAPTPDSALRTPQSGEVVRDARFTDYHDVLAERLKSLTAAVNELSGENTRSLWYADTGLILERGWNQSRRPQPSSRGAAYCRTARWVSRKPSWLSSRPPAAAADCPGASSLP